MLFYIAASKGCHSRAPLWIFHGGYHPGRLIKHHRNHVWISQNTLAINTDFLGLGINPQAHIPNLDTVYAYSTSSNQLFAHAPRAHTSMG